MAWHDWECHVGERPLGQTLGDAALDQALEEDGDAEQNEARASNKGHIGCGGMLLVAGVIALVVWAAARLLT